MYQNTIQQKFMDNRLMNSIAANDLEQARNLILNGANPNCVNDQANTPLHICAIHNCLEIAKLLIRWGAHFEKFNNDKMTPLMIAEANDYNELALHLFKEEIKIIMNMPKEHTVTQDKVA